MIEEVVCLDPRVTTKMVSMDPNSARNRITMSMLIVFTAAHEVTNGPLTRARRRPLPCHVPSTLESKNRSVVVSRRRFVCVKCGGTIELYYIDDHSGFRHSLVVHPKPGASLCWKVLAYGRSQDKASTLSQRLEYKTFLSFLTQRDHFGKMSIKNSCLLFVHLYNWKRCTIHEK